MTATIGPVLPGIERTIVFIVQPVTIMSMPCGVRVISVLGEIGEVRAICYGSGTNHRGRSGGNYMDPGNPEPDVCAYIYLGVTGSSD